MAETQPSAGTSQPAEAPAAGAEPAPPAAARQAGHGAPTAARLCLFACAAAVLAGVAAWLVGESTLHAFMPPTRKVTSMGMTFDMPTYADQSAADRKNASLAFGVLGAGVGLALGLSGGLARGSPGAGVRAGLAGLSLGGTLPVAVSFALLPIYYARQDTAQEDLSRDLLLPLLIHGGIYAAVGAAGGAALGLGLGSGVRLASVTAGGLAGGMLGAVAYEVLGALALSSEKTTQPVAAFWGARLLAASCVALLTALTASAVASPRAPR